MSIDPRTLASELGVLRKLAENKWRADPLPTGRAAEAALQSEIEAHGLHEQIVQLETDGYAVLPHVRDAIQPQELFWVSVTPEMIERNPAWFATLMGLTSAGPWIQDGPDPKRLGMGPISGSQFD